MQLEKWDAYILLSVAIIAASVAINIQTIGHLWLPRS
jgi:hypothetical protein